MSKKDDIQITISNRSLVRIVAVIVGTVLLFRFFENIIHPITLIFISAFLALALNPVVSSISNRLRVKSRISATAIAYLGVIAVLITLGIIIIPPLVSQITDFLLDLPQTFRNVSEQQSSLGSIVRRYELQSWFNSIAEDTGSRLKDLPGPVISTASRVVANLISIIAVLVMTFMMLIEGPSWLQKYWHIIPKEKVKHQQTLANRMYGVITGFVNGQVLIALLGGFFAFVTLLITSTIFQVSINVVALAGIVALLALVPMIGNIIGTIIVVIVCSLSSIPLAITMLIYFAVYQQIENSTIQPYIQSRNTELTPLLVFISALLGIGFGGILGGFVAIPVAGCVSILINDFLVRKGFKEN